MGKRSISMKWPIICLLIPLMQACATEDPRNDQPEGTQWPDGYPTESVASIECAVDDCLLVEEGSTYCSIDAVVMTEGTIFSPKSRLTVQGGAYPVSGRATVENLSITVDTSAGQSVLQSVGQAVLERQPEVVEDGWIWEYERITVSGAFQGASLGLQTFLLNTTRWPHQHFRLGDPEDLFWFFEVRRNLYVQLDGQSSLFPGLSNTTIHYAPCSMRDQPDEIFSFEFDDGSSLDLTVRTINGISSLGYSLGRLFAAQGSILGDAVDVTTPSDLAYFGSLRYSGELALPTLVVRTAATGNSCGVIFDSWEWESSSAVNGYTAYRMTCDERRGEALPLQAATYPENRFAWP